MGEIGCPAPETKPVTPTLKNLKEFGNPLVVPWLGLSAFTAEGPGSIPGGGTKIP